MTSEDRSHADKEKSKVALTSVLAAVGLTSFKLVIGLLTNSLGILAEAAHSGLDLVAALVTFLAVRLSGKPADKEHNYGHGKIENLSALFETLLLLLTCVWIIYEAIQRLFGSKQGVVVEASIWSFVVMATSIVIDYNRSKMLDKAARETQKSGTGSRCTALQHGYLELLRGHLRFDRCRDQRECSSLENPA